MTFSRRNFVQASALLATGTAIPKTILASSERRQSQGFDIQDPKLLEIANAGVDAAKAAGAVYADARLDHLYTYSPKGFPAEKESMFLGVRVLVNGYWGFASSPIWSKDESARLARSAIRNARANLTAKARITELAALSGADEKLTGHWVTPIEEDPFRMSGEEIEDFVSALSIFTLNIGGVEPQSFGTEYSKQNKLFVSSVGHSLSQVLYRTQGDFPLKVKHKGMETVVALDTTTPSTAGFEYLRRQPLRNQILELVEETRRDMELPYIPVDVGRYEVVMDANSVTSLVSDSIGLATELDRALGYEANAAGTSYIVDPIEMVGSFKIGSPAVNISANRSEPGGAATVQWDDEGITPKEFVLVKEGILHDMQTDRESASVLKDVYSRQQKTVQSYGCSFAPNSGFAPLTHCANLKLQPSTENEYFDSLVSKVEKGIAIKRGGVDMDHQQISGLLMGQTFEIKNGKRISRIGGAAINFRTPELWAAVTRIGGPSSMKRISMPTFKGQPTRLSYHSVTAVPVTLKEATVIDIMRKA